LRVPPPNSEAAPNSLYAFHGRYVTPHLYIDLLIGIPTPTTQNIGELALERVRDPYMYIMAGARSC
jgi:hypothetical protein